MTDLLKSDRVHNDLFNQIIAEKPASFQAADVINDIVIGKVAKHAWETELDTKFKVPYSTTWSVQFAKPLGEMRTDTRKDDGVLTPKKIKEIDPRKVTNEKPIIAKVDVYPN